jgi:hypothetical protein
MIKPIIWNKRFSVSHSTLNVLQSLYLREKYSLKNSLKNNIYSPFIRSNHARHGPMFLL